MTDLKSTCSFIEHAIKNLLLLLVSILFIAVYANAEWIDRSGNKLPNTDERKSVGTFNAQLIFTDNERKLFQIWAVPSETVEIDNIKRVEANQPISAFIVFGGCVATPDGKCSVSMRFRVIQPDGLIFTESPTMEVWHDKDAPPGRSIELSVQYLRLKVGPDKPIGPYTVQAQVRDNETGVVIDLQKKFEVTQSN